MAWNRQRTSLLLSQVAPIFILTLPILDASSTQAFHLKTGAEESLNFLPENCRSAGNFSPKTGQILKELASRPSEAGLQKLGGTYLQERAFNCAASAFREALHLDKSDWRARYSLALALIGKRDHQQAVTALRKVIAQEPDFTEGHYALGVALQNLGDLNSAAEEFKTALRLDPQFFQATYNLAEILDSQKRYAAEVFYLNGALALNPSPQIAYSFLLSLGAAYEHDGNTDEAIRTLQKLVAKFPKSAEPHSSLGTLYAEHFRYREAESEFEEALRLNPGDNETKLSLAKTMIEMGDTTAALPLVREYVGEKPGDYEGYYVLGRAFQTQGDFVKATEELQRAVKLGPDSYDARYNLGVVLGHSGHPDEAIEELKTAQNLNPREPGAAYELSLLYRKKKDFQHGQQEVVAFQKAKDLTGRASNAAASGTRANELLVKGDTQEAIDEYERALNLAPDNAKLHYNLALALEKLDRRQQEEEELAKAIELDPNLAEAHNLLGVLFMRDQKLNDSEREFNIALEIKPAYAEAQSNLGTLYGQQGKTDLAATWFRHAIKSNPRYVQAYVNLGLVLAQQEHYADAEKVFQQALRLDPHNRQALTALSMLSSVIAR